LGEANNPARSLQERVPQIPEAFHRLRSRAIQGEANQVLTNSTDHQAAAAATTTSFFPMLVTNQSLMQNYYVINMNDIFL